jgi:hypothetical protein
MSELVERALRFATGAHRRIDQRRKYSWKPYEVHLKAVAEIVVSVTDDPETIAAAWLHDVVEDTPATVGDLNREFGREVADLVAQLTDVSRPADGNRATRKRIDCEHLSRASSRAQTVKLADLIDNCRDICANDPRFGRVFLAEMGAFLDVLGQGDPRLLKRARREMERWSAKLDSSPSSDDVGRSLGDRESTDLDSVLRGSRTLRQFAGAFVARDIAQPLLSFDRACSVSEALASMRDEGFTVAGVREKGRVGGWVAAGSAAEESGSCGELKRDFAATQVLDCDAALSEVIHVLTRHDYCFVRTLGDVNGVITRADFRSPIVRMRLFGIITFIEMMLTERIRDLWPGEEWSSKLTPARLEKTRALQLERSRRGQPCALLDCLQFSDRTRILMEDEKQIAAFGFSSKAAARRVFKELESLRNNLAHAQDIVTHDWAQIARMARRIESLAEPEH